MSLGKSSPSNTNSHSAATTMKFSGSARLRPLAFATLAAALPLLRRRSPPLGTLFRSFLRRLPASRSPLCYFASVDRLDGCGFFKSAKLRRRPGSPHFTAFPPAFKQVGLHHPPACKIVKTPPCFLIDRGGFRRKGKGWTLVDAGGRGPALPSGPSPRRIASARADPPRIPPPRSSQSPPPLPPSWTPGPIPGVGRATDEDSDPRGSSSTREALPLGPCRPPSHSPAPPPPPSSSRSGSRSSPWRSPR